MGRKDSALRVLTILPRKYTLVHLRSLVPLDKQAVLATVRKTGKVIIVHEATRTAGFGAELAALIVEEAFEYLDGPIVRVTSPDAPVPAAPALAAFYLPDTKKIRDAIHIRPTLYLTLTFDHRILDGAAADRFLSEVVHLLENWPH